MQDLIKAVEAKYQKKQVVDVRSGDTVRVSQRITEGDKTRTQVFEGLVIRTDRKKSLTSRITVRRISSGVGVEKSFLLHSPLIEKVEVIKRSKVRRNNLSYMRARSGKSARLVGTEFDYDAVNTIEEQMEEAEVVPGEPETKGAKATEEINEAETDSKEDSKEEAKDEAAKTEKAEESKGKAKDKKAEKSEPKADSKKKPEASKEDSKESKDKK